LKWQWCTSKGEPSDVETNFQMDLVGNILQISGALKTKACQKCKTGFKPTTKIEDVKQDVKIYKCSDCEFESNMADDALTHSIQEKKHTLKIKKKSRVVGVKRLLIGSAIVERTKNDIKIRCKKCHR
jgi:NAD-dependent SIR2 family protein deacetylase